MQMLRGAFGAVVCGLTILAAASSSGQITPEGGGYRMRVKYVRGQALRYEMRVNMSGQGLPGAMAMTMPVVMRVVDVKNGITTLETEAGPALMNGRQAGPVQKQTMKLDASGKILGKNAAASQMGLQGIGTVFPNRPVKVGETFTQNFSSDVGGQKLNVSATTKLVSVKTVGGKKVAELSLTTNGTGAAVARGTGTSLVSAVDGSLVQMTMNQTLTVKNANGQTMTMQQKVEMVRK